MKKKRISSVRDDVSFADYSKLPARPKHRVRVWYDNYMLFVSRFPIGSLPSDLLHEHQMFMQQTNNCTSLRTYHNSDTIRKNLNSYLQNLNKYLAQRYGTRLGSIENFNTEIMQYDQDYINGLGALSKGAGRKKAKPSAPARKRAPNKAKKQAPVKKQKDLYYKKREYDFETVDTISDSVKLIRRFCNLVNAKIPQKRLAAFIRSLQKAIIERIRKKSPHAKEIAHIQDLAIASYRKASKGFVFVPLDEVTRDKYYAIGRGEKVRGSVSVLKRFVGLIDVPYSTAMKNRAVSIVESINYQLKKGIIPKSDPYYERVKDAERSLKRAVTNHQAVHVSASALNGLNGIIEYETVQDDFFDDGGTELAGLEHEAETFSDEPQPNAVPAALTGKQLAQMKFDSVRLDSYHTQLLGEPARNFFMLVYGPPWHGKTSYVLSLSKCIAEQVGKVAYISPEQHGSKTQQFVAAGMGALNTEGLEYFADFAAAGDLRQYACIVVDSGNAAGLKLQDADAVRQMLPSTALIVILQSTKGDDFKGEQGWRHIPDIVLKVKDRKVITEKNRYKTEPAEVPTPTPIAQPIFGQESLIQGLNGTQKKSLNPW